MAGRKSLRDELKIFKRYSELTDPYFRVLKTKLESTADPAAQMWAVEQLTKAFVKMIPTKLEGDGDDGELVIKLISYGGNPSSQLPTTALSTPATPSD